MGTPNLIQRLGHNQQYDLLTGDQDLQYLVDQVMHAKDHKLLIPPRFEELDLRVDQPADDGVRIGLFSSGSTGKPKCIWNRRQNLLLNGERSREMFSLDPSDRVVILASPWHVAGLTWALMAELAGVDYQMVIPRTRESEQWGERIAEYQPTKLFTVPTVLRYLVQQNNWHCPTIAYGGASIEPEMYKQLRPFGTTLVQAYGQTEAGGLIAAHHHDLSEVPYQYESICCGQPPRGVRLECRSSDAEHPAPIKVLSPTAIYEHWYDTGDVGFIDEHGNLNITGRKEKKHGNCNMISSVTSIAHK
jgi:acyl-coenzyme A synthetase/AMP-(fatty) acid ligase